MEGSGSRVWNAEGAAVRTLAAISLIIVCSIAVYANSLRGDFVCDDRPMLVNNPKIGDSRFLVESFTSGVWKNSNLDYPDQFLYRPLFLVNLYLNHRLWGSNAAGFHAMNLLLHVVNSMLVFFLIRRITLPDRLFPALGSALIFAVHPVHVESVSWISGATDLLATVFFLSAFLLYVRSTAERRSATLVFSVALYVLALLSKEVSVVFIAIAMIHDWVYDRKVRIRALIPFMLVTALYVLIRAVALGKPAGVLSLSVAGFLRVPEFLCAYIRLLIAPWPLRFYFVLPEQGLVGPTAVLLCIGAVSALVLLAVRQRAFLFGISWLFLALAPPLLIAFYRNPIIADRFLYLPSVGFVILVALLLERMQAGYRQASLIVVIVIVLLSSVMTVSANSDWGNDEVFYRKAIQTTPGYSAAYAGLGNVYSRQGDIEKAAAFYEQAAQRASGKDREDLYDLLGSLYGKNGFFDESIRYYRQELALHPGSTRALTGLGNDLLAQGDHRSALGYYHDAVTQDPKNYEACYNLALAFEMTGDRANAAMNYRLFIERAPAAEYAAVIDEVKLKLSRWSAEPGSVQSRRVRRAARQ